MGKNNKISASVRPLNSESSKIKEKYMELIMAVATKFPGETRHETALRYILERENGTQISGTESTQLEHSKWAVCEECGKEFRATLKLGEKEFLDGYHGECPKPFCGYRYFESI